MLGPEDDSEEGLLIALHKYLAATPSVMLGLSLPDAVGDRVAQNQPGTDQEYPNWRIPLTDAEGKAVLIEDMPNMPLFQKLADALTGPLDRRYLRGAVQRG